MEGGRGRAMIYEASEEILTPYTFQEAIQGKAIENM